MLLRAISPFPTVFSQKACFLGASKGVIVREWVNVSSNGIDLGQPAKSGQAGRPRLKLFAVIQYFGRQKKKKKRHPHISDGNQTKRTLYRWVRHIKTH